MIFFKINSKTLSRNPTDITQGKFKLQNSDRTMDGTLVVDIIAVKDKVEFTWDFLTDSEMRKLMAEIDSGEFATVEYNDPKSPNPQTLRSIIAQAGDVSYSPYFDYRTQSIIWKDVKVAFVER